MNVIFLHVYILIFLNKGKPVGTPDASNFWRTIERHKINGLFTAPTALRAIKRLDPEGIHPQEFNLSSLRGVFLAGNDFFIKNG